MTKPAVSFLRRTMVPIALTALFVLAGCGIKGPLELPEGTQVSGNESKGRFVPAKAAQLPGYQPGTRELRAQKQLGNPVKRDEPFVLDSLLN